MIAAQLLSLIESQATRRFVLHVDNDPTESEGLILWVFNPDIYYSSSARPPSAHRAMKIFYRTTNDARKSLDENSSMEELRTNSTAEFAELESALRTSTRLLPPTAREFQGWTVGLLDRYEQNAGHGMEHNLFNRQPPPDFSPTHLQGQFSPDRPEGFEALLE